MANICVIIHKCTTSGSTFHPFALFIMYDSSWSYISITIKSHCFNLYFLFAWWFKCIVKRAVLVDIGTRSEVSNSSTETSLLFILSPTLSKFSNCCFPWQIHREVLFVGWVYVSFLILGKQVLFLWITWLS